jgi:gluconokinase
MAGLRSRSAVVVMGVSGCGKSTVARACAQRLGWTMVEGDDFHTPESVAKMRAGTPLTDADRTEWLQRLAGILRRHHAGDGAHQAGSGVFLTCSALRRSYRELLRTASPGLGFVFLELRFDEALCRASERPGHFFPASLVESQFATLEPPQGEPGVLAVDAVAPVDAVADAVVAWLGADRGTDGAGRPDAPRR